MTTATTTLTSFLLDRLAEDEAAARDAALAAGDQGFGGERIESGKSWTTSYHEVVRKRQPGQSKKTLADTGGFVGLSIAPHIARHDPARVLADVTAKRAIVEIARPNVDERGNEEPGGGVPDILRALAAVYADHDSFREEWR